MIGGITAVIDLVISNKLKSNDVKYCLQILCKTSIDSCVRLKMRQSNVFLTLIKIANTSHDSSEIDLVRGFLDKLNNSY